MKILAINRLKTNLAMTYKLNIKIHRQLAYLACKQYQNTKLLKIKLSYDI